MTMHLIAALAAVVFAAAFEPARLVRGEAPLPAPQTVGWEQAVLRVHVDERGAVDGVETLVGTEPLAARLTRAVATWRFEAATDGNTTVPAGVLVAAVYRPPLLHDVPAFRGLRVGAGLRSDVPVPTSTPAPAYPPNAQGDGTVVVEVRLRADGEVQSATIATSTASGFDHSAVAAARRWRFAPATREGRSVAASAYLVFGFRQPVVAIERRSELRRSPPR